MSKTINELLDKIQTVPREIAIIMVQDLLDQYFMKLKDLYRSFGFNEGYKMGLEDGYNNAYEEIEETFDPNIVF